MLYTIRLNSSVLVWFSLIVAAILPGRATRASTLELHLNSESGRAALGALDSSLQVPTLALSYIRSVTTPSSNQEAALLQLARDYVKAIQGIHDQVQSNHNAESILESESCIRSQFDSDAYAKISKIHSLSLSTYESARLGIRLNTFLAQAMKRSVGQAHPTISCRFMPAYSPIRILEKKSASSKKFEAATSASSCRSAGTVIYFGNGMFNSMNDVQNSMVELQKLDINEIETNPGRIQYKFALNLSESDLDNILAVIHERIQGDLSYFWDVLDGTLPLPAWLDTPVEHALEANIHSDISDQIVSDLQNDIDAGAKVILVSHSQGNFYAEEATKQLLSNRHSNDPHSIGLGNVRVATPARTHFDFPYYTFSDDHIIGLVREIFGAPTANLIMTGSGPGPTQDPNGHDFVMAYLRGPESREKIRQAILNEARMSSSPCALM